MLQTALKYTHNLNKPTKKVLTMSTNSLKDTIIKEAIKNSGSKFCSVTFIKKSNGEYRTVVFNSKEGVKLVTGNNAEAVAKRKINNPRIINVVDVTVANRETDRQKGWRSFDTADVISMKVDGLPISFG